MDYSEPLMVCLTALSWMTPVFVVYVFGMVAFLVNRKLYPERFFWAAVAMVLFLSSDLVTPLLNIWHLHSLENSGGAAVANSFLASGIIGPLFFPLAFGLLLFAIFRSGPLWIEPKHQVQVSLPDFGYGIGFGLVAAAILLGFYSHVNTPLVYGHPLNLSFYFVSRIAPSLLLCILGVMAARSNRIWYRLPCLLVEGAMCLLAISTAGLGLMQFFFAGKYWPDLLSPVWERNPIARSFWLVAPMACIFMQATAFGMLIRAVFLRAVLGLNPNALPPEFRLRLVVRVGIAGLSVLLYGFALASPAVFDTGRLSLGVECLVEDPMALFWAFWWANLPLVVAIISLLAGQRVLSGICGIIALLLGLSFYPQVFNQYGSSDPVQISYWLWLASMAVMAVPIALPRRMLRALGPSFTSPSRLASSAEQDPSGTV